MELIRGLGFIGRALKDQLERSGYQVGIISRSLELPTDDIGVVYYLASFGNMYDQKDRNLIYQVNCVQVEQLLKQLAGNFGLFVYISTSSVYGPKLRPMEEAMKLEGSTHYALSKIAGERVVKKYSGQSNCVVIRPFSITGVGEQETHLIPSAIKAARQQITFNLDPDPVHDFLDINDFLTGLQTIVDCHLEWGQGPLEVYNLGSGRQHRNDEVVEMVKAETNQEMKIKVMKHQRSYDSDELWQADLTKVKKLGWKPTKPLYLTIKEMVKTYDNENA